MRRSEYPPVSEVAGPRPSVLWTGFILGALGLLLLRTAGTRFIAASAAEIYIPSSVSYLSASLLIAASGLLSAGMVARGRLRAIAASEHARTRPPVAPLSNIPDVLRAHTIEVRLPSFRWAPEWLAGWPQIVVCAIFGVVAMAAIAPAWTAEDQQMLGPSAQQLYGGLFILLAFPLLVLERIYAKTPRNVLPEAPQIERLLRVPLLTFVALGTTTVLASIGLEWPLTVEKAIAFFAGLVSLELVLRCVAVAFMPLAPIDTRRSVADSAVAGLLRPSLPSFATVSTAVKSSFGIDLSRSWALSFVRQAAVPIGLGMVFFAWCVTGITALGLNERAVYERFGVPVAVFGPGLHVHLPWPFGIMRRVELGVAHEIPIVLSTSGEPQINAGKIGPETNIEGVAPASADRLWDSSHPSEASYLVASESQGKQSFQVANIDLRVVYRIALSDKAAEEASYSVANPEALIRAITGQLLVRYFARYTLLDVLGQSRERFSNELRGDLQARLQGLSTGIEVIAVVVEAIHPPPDAASAYHYVQAAEILAQSQVSLRRADAIHEVKTAEQTATEDRNNALSAAAELVDQAHAESVLFQGDRQAYHQDGRVFLFERWLSRLGSSLPKSSFIVIDSRLNGAATPTIDLRSFALPGPADQPNSPGQSPSAAKPSMPSSPGSVGNPDDEGGD